MERYKLEIVNNHGDRYIRCEPAPNGSWVMFKDVAALQARVAELEGALRFYADPFKYTDIHGDDVRVPHFYSETDFGETARAALEGKKDE
jgi:hypothetical protein